MATVNSLKIVKMIIDGDGYYPGDDIKVVKIVQYNNQFNGKIAYGLIYEGQPLNMYHTAAACHNPVTIWEAR
jgi:hypothetical protein